MLYNVESRSVEVFIPTFGVEQTMVAQSASGYHGGSSSHWQSFTATFSGGLELIDVSHTYPNSNGDTVVYLELYEGEGVDGSLIAVASNTNTVNPSTGAQYYTYNFDGVSLVDEEVYTWRIYFNTSQNIGWIGFSGSNPYSGGVGYYCCGDYTDDDFIFQFKAKELLSNWVQL